MPYDQLQNHSSSVHYQFSAHDANSSKPFNAHGTGSSHPPIPLPPIPTQGWDTQDINEEYVVGWGLPVKKTDDCPLESKIAISHDAPDHVLSNEWRVNDGCHL